MHLAARSRVVVGFLLACLYVGAVAQEAHAQDSLIDVLLYERRQVRMMEVLGEIGVRAEVFGALEIVAEREARRRVGRSMPSLRMPAGVGLVPLAVRPSDVEEVQEEEVPMRLERLAWRRIPPDEAEHFIDRFIETLWTNAGRHGRTAIDTMATPRVRAHLHAAFGPPTRTPIARGRPEMVAGSASVQFEYWFVVNDSIPFVVMDRDGPFANGVVMVADETHIPVLETVVDDLARRLLAVPSLMPYVDYYHADQRNQWYRTGFDGRDFYTVETERPRWARRSRDGGTWYDFR